MTTRPKWRIPRDTDIERETSRLSISEILDRQMEMEKILEIADQSSDEWKRAQIMLRATYIVLGQRYFKK